MEKKGAEKPSSGAMIASLLLQERVITQEQLQYANRVRSKLHTGKTLIAVLQDLGSVTKEQVAATLRKNSMSLRIGDLLVELGYLREGDLAAALSLQKQGAERKMLGDIIIENGFIDERKFIEVLSYQLGFPLAELEFRKVAELPGGRRCAATCCSCAAWPPPAPW